MITIPVYDMILLPGVSFYIKKDILERWSNETPEVGSDVLFLLLREQKDGLDYSAEDFYPIGFSARIAEIDSEGLIRMKTLERVEFSDIGFSDGHIHAEAVICPEAEDLPEEEAHSTFERIRTDYLECVQKFQWGLWVRAAVLQWNSLNEMMCASSGYMNLSWEEKYSIMAENSCRRRSERIEKAVYEFLEGAQVSKEAKTAQQNDQDRIYREAALKKQISYLQKQLEELHPEEISEVDQLAQKVEASGMNETAMREAKKVLSRIRQEGREGHEYGKLCEYLDFVTGLFWKHEEAQPIDLAEVEHVLDEDHYGLRQVKERIIQQMAVLALNKKQSGSILLFVGAPGTGKTSIGQSIARALGRKYVRISLGGIRDEAEIRGHRRTYVGAMPGRIMEGIRRSGVSNPVIVLDEVDKLSKDYSGDPASALLEVLDPEQNHTFTDHYMNVPYDLSDVLFVCTANAADTIPEPLLNRMEVIQFPGYTAVEKFYIAKKHLLPKVMENTGISQECLRVTDSALRCMIESYTMEAGVRGLKKQLETMCRHAAVKLVRGEKRKITVSEKRLTDYLGRPNLHHDRRQDSPVAGTVTGLAWTSGGGEILFVESRLVKGEGELIVTGQIGDVMKESVQIAVSMVKLLFDEECGQLEGHDLHIHVPAGAVPKDGPSAGITIVTAIASLLTGRTVDPGLAMTGEISLRGKVLPIGGLPEKLMAAQRAGITKVLIPADNQEDLKEVAEEVRRKLEIVPVSSIEEVLEATGIPREY